MSKLNPKKIKSVEDLTDKRIGYQKKNLFEEKLVSKYKESTAVPFESYDAMLDAIVNDKIDVIVGSYPLIYFAQKKGFPFIKIINKIPQSNLDLVFSIRNDYPEALSILNKGLNAISNEDKIKIHSKWFFGEYKIQSKISSKKDKNHISLTKKESSYLKNKENIKICVLPNWLPFEQIDENIQHKGIGADILRELSKKLDKKFVLVPTTKWAQSLQNIRNRKCDILPVAMNVPSRRDAMDFTKPYVKEPFVVATTQDKFYIRDINDLSNKKIGIVKSYAIIEVLKTQNPLIEVVEVANTKEGLEKVSNGELYGYVDIMPTIAYFIQKHGLFDLKIAGKLLSSIDLSIASRNDEPLLNSIMQKALDTISEEEMRKIVGRWIEIKVQQQFDYRQLFYIITIFIAILFVVLYKNRSINKINRKLEHAHEELSQQQDMVDKHVMILTTDLEGKIIYANEAYCKKVGFEKEELIGYFNNIMRHPHMSQEFFKELWETITNGKMWKGEIKNLTKDKRTVYFEVVIEPLMKEGRKIGYRSISKDITDKKRIEELSITDTLTGLYNRLKLDELKLTQIDLYQRYKTPFSLILLDIDDFKLVNDNYGYDVGDEVLKSLAHTLQANIRKTDYVGRWGGEEFLIICQNTNVDESYVLAEKIRKAVQIKYFEGIDGLTVSLGVASYNDSDKISSFFKRVDKALYEAKRNGKNQTVQSMGL